MQSNGENRNCCIKDQFKEICISQGKRLDLNGAMKVKEDMKVQMK